MVKITDTHAYTLADVRELEKNTRDVRLRLRIMAVRLVWEGYPALAVGHILGLTGETVSRYVRVWNTDGPPGLVPRKAPGQPSKIAGDIERAIVAALQSTPQAVGYGISANWDSRVLHDFLRDRYQIEMSRGALRKWLTRHGFSWTRPTYVLVKADPVKQQAFREELQTLKKT